MKKCEVSISEPPYYLHWHQCRRWATSQRADSEGTIRPVCSQHANVKYPPRVVSREVE